MLLGLSMLKASTLLVATVALLSQSGCQTSCGKHADPLLWADGTTRNSNGLRVYETTPLDGVWLSFPSYRDFRLPHGFGTKDVAIEAYLSLGEARPVQTVGDSSKFAIATAAEVLATIPDENSVILENSTCENQYYLFARITERPSSSSNAGTPADA